MESFSWLCGNHHLKEVGPLLIAFCAAVQHLSIRKQSRENGWFGDSLQVMLVGIMIPETRTEDGWGKLKTKVSDDKYVNKL